MRSARRLLFAALASTAAIVVPASPSAEATPLACTDDCTITSTFFAYVAPITEIASGASVSWTSLDTSHPTLEQQLLGGSGSPCFNVPVGVNNPSPPVTFDIVGGALTATTGTSTLPCTSAIALGDIGFVQPYQCLIHTNMQAALLVTSA